jgi:hypothetical protein
MYEHQTRDDLCPQSTVLTKPCHLCVSFLNISSALSVRCTHPAHQSSLPPRTHRTHAPTHVPISAPGIGLCSISEAAVGICTRATSRPLHPTSNFLLEGNERTIEGCRGHLVRRCCTVPISKLEKCSISRARVRLHAIDIASTRYIGLSIAPHSSPYSVRQHETVVGIEEFFSAEWMGF